MTTEKEYNEALDEAIETEHNRFNTTIEFFAGCDTASDSVKEGVLFSFKFLNDYIQENIETLLKEHDDVIFDRAQRKIKDGLMTQEDFDNRENALRTKQMIEHVTNQEDFSKDEIQDTIDWIENDPQTALNAILENQDLLKEMQKK